MSLSTLAREAIEKRAAKSAAVTPTPPAAVAAGFHMDVGTPPSKEDALSAISKYIPTEIVTLYLFGISIQSYPSAASTSAATPMLILYLALLAFTPVCFWLIFAARFRAQTKEKAWPKWREFSWWRCVASALAFAIWALAVPKTNLVPLEYLPWIAIAALGVSTVFSLVEKAIDA